MKFWIDYKASLEIEADNADEAEAIFYQVYGNDKTREFSEVTNVEKISDEE